MLPISTALLLFTVCRLVNGEFQLEDRQVFLKAEIIVAVEEIDVGGDVVCSKIGALSGHSVYVHGSAREVLESLWADIKEEQEDFVYKEVPHP